MPETSVEPPKNMGTAVEVTYLPLRRTWRHRFVDDLRSWSRHTFSRDSFVTSLKSLLWVVPLTALIWIWAERQEVVPANNVAVHIQSPGDKLNRVVRLAPDPSVTADLEGPQADVEQVRDWLSKNPIPLAVDEAFTDGQHLISLRPQLNNLPIMKKWGVTVKGCSPQEVTVFVERVTEVEVDVTAEPSPDTSGLQPPVFDPPKVKLRAPDSEIEKAKKAGKLAAYATFKQFTELQKPGTHDLTLVPLAAPPSMNPASARLSPSAVSARIQVPQKVQSTALIHAVIMAGYPKVPNATQFPANYDNRIDVQVTGPEATIAGLQSGNPPVVAFFQVDISNPENHSPRQAELTFKLPEGVRPTDPDPKTRMISYTLDPRTPGRTSETGGE